MRHLRGGEYITPNISLIDDGKRVYSEKKATISMFPLYLNISENWEEDNLFGSKDYYWKVNIPDGLYDTINNALIPTGDISYIYTIPEQWLNDNPIYIDGHKVNTIFKEYNMIYIYCENDYPFTNIVFYHEIYGKLYQNEIEFYLAGA